LPTVQNLLNFNKI